MCDHANTKKRDFVWEFTNIYLIAYFQLTVNVYNLKLWNKVTSGVQLVLGGGGELIKMVIQDFLPLWAIFMNENGGVYFTVVPSFDDVFPAPVSWFVYSNLLQKVSKSFINPAHLRWRGYFMHVVPGDIPTSPQ